MAKKNISLKEKSISKKDGEENGEKIKKVKSGENIMRKIRIEKMILSASATGEMLEKEKKLLELITKKKALITKSTKRIPQFKISPNTPVGVMVTIRDKEQINELLPRLLTSIDRKVKKRQFTTNNFSFGVKEYIEIPGVEYQRDIGIVGFNVVVTFVRTGKRVTLKKIKRGKSVKKQDVTSEEILEFIEKNFKAEVI